MSARHRTPQKRPTIPGRGNARDEILAAYDRALRHDPDMTQGEFMLHSRVGRFKTEKDAARYFRAIRDGERSGDDLWAEAARHYGGGMADMFQVEMPDRKGNWRSFNLEAGGARSQFDIPAIEAALRNDPSMLNQKAREFSRRYDIDEGDIDVSRFRVRRVLSTSKRALHVVIAQ